MKYLWVESYEVAIDAYIGIPCRYVAATVDAINKGRIVKLCTEERALALNEEAMARHPSTRDFVEKRLAEQWAKIEAEYLAA